MSALSRSASLSGAVGIGLVVAGLAADRAPTASWPDDRITAWYASHGSAGWLVSASLIALGAPFLLLFTATVVDRLEAAGAGRLWRGVVQGAGTAWAVVLLVGAGLYAAVPAGRVFNRAPAPGPDVSRYFLGASYGTLVMFSALAAAVFAGSLSVAGLRSGALPRWLAVLGIPASVLMLANALLPMAVITLWFLLASTTLAVRPAGRAPRPAPAGAPIAAPAR